jgi:hypothetical protein
LLLLIGHHRQPSLDFEYSDRQTWKYPDTQRGNRGLPFPVSRHAYERPLVSV